MNNAKDYNQTVIERLAKLETIMEAIRLAVVNLEKEFDDHKKEDDINFRALRDSLRFEQTELATTNLRLKMAVDNLEKLTTSVDRIIKFQMKLVGIFVGVSSTLAVIWGIIKFIVPLFTK